MPQCNGTTTTGAQCQNTCDGELCHHHVASKKKPAPKKSSTKKPSTKKPATKKPATKKSSK